MSFIYEREKVGLRVRPVNARGNPLVLDVRIKSEPAEKRINVPLSVPSVRDYDSCENVEVLDICAALQSEDPDGKQTVVMSATCPWDTEVTTDPLQMRWIHMQSHAKSFDDFKHIALNCMGLPDHEKPIVLKVMERVRRTEKHFVHGHFLDATVFRGDGRDPASDATSDEATEDRSCLFICTPWLHLDRLRSSTLAKDSTLHPVRSLIQTLYRLESTEKREGQQVLSNYPSIAEGKLLYVPQLWALITPTRHILTCSHTPQKELLGSYITMESPSQASVVIGGASQVRIVDFWSRLFFFPVKDCQTWFSLMDKIVNNILSDANGEIEIDLERCEFYTPEQIPVTDGNWIEIVQQQKSSFVNLVIVMKDETINENDSAIVIERISGEGSVSSSGKNNRSNEEVTPISEPKYPIAQTYASTSYVLPPDVPPINLVPGHSLDYSQVFSTDFDDRPPSPSPEAIKIAPQSTHGQTLPGHHDVTIEVQTEYPNLHRLERPSTDRRPKSTYSSDLEYDNEERISSRRHKTTSTRLWRSRGRPGIVVEELGRRRISSHDQDPRLDTFVDTRRDRASAPYHIASRESRVRASRNISYQRSTQKSSGNIINEEIPKKKPSQIYYVPEDRATSVPPPVEIITPQPFSFSEPIIRSSLDSTTGKTAKETAPPTLAPPLIAPRTEAPGSSQTGRLRARSLIPSAKMRQQIPPVFTWPTGAPSPDILRDIMDESSGTAPEDVIATVSTSPPERIVSNNNTGLALDRILNETAEFLEKHKPMGTSLEDIDAGTEEEVNYLLKRLEPSRFDTEKPGDDIDKALEMKVDKEVNASNASLNIKLVTNAAKEILGFFVPLPYDSPVIKVYWGALQSILETVKVLWYERRQIESEISRGRVQAWIVVDLPNAGLNINIESQRPINHCKSCRARREYASVEDALQHLRDQHWRQLDVPESVARQWISPADRILQHLQLAYFEDLMDTWSTFNLETLNAITSIRRGMDFAGTRAPEYRVPRAMVNGFHSILSFQISTASMLKSLPDSTSFLAAGPSKEWLEARAKAYDQLFGCRHDTIQLLQEGKNALIMMLHTDDYSDSILYEAVGPEYLLAIVLENLSELPSAGKWSIEDFYTEHYAQKKYQALRNPTRRLLQDVNLFCEEVGPILQTFSDQGKIAGLYAKVLDPSSHKVTSQSRLSHFGLESRLLEKISSKTRGQYDNFHHLLVRGVALAAQTQQGVEIQQEDHGKAILVFTIVTILFLPLSFVTSYLGMNTVDIRNLDRPQWLFWAIATPITAVTVLIALGVGFYFDDLRELMEKRKGRSKLIPAESKADRPKMGARFAISTSRLPTRRSSKYGDSFAMDEV